MQISIGEAPLLQTSSGLLQDDINSQMMLKNRYRVCVLGLHLDKESNADFHWKAILTQVQQVYYTWKTPTTGYGNWIRVRRSIEMIFSARSLAFECSQLKIDIGSL